MRNLEQIRATNALEAAKNIGTGPNEGKNIAKKVPTQIRNNGLLGAAAFAQDSEKGYPDVMKAIIDHLRHNDIELTKAAGIKEFITEIGQADSTQLRVVTAEAMAYLNYLRRFAD